ncbi:MAG: 50S ribosomal protein L11 methyltransferase [Deinococcales bacterium]|jgi:ribosomal protein L11 methyltransferase
MPGPLDPESVAVARLFDLGSLGVVEETGPDGPEVVAYFDSERELGLGGRWEDVGEVDYVAAYRAGLKPVRVGPLVIAPSHRRASLGAGEQVVWLDPGTAFGTGHHETTRLALEALAAHDLTGRSVLDVGAGSGILTIAADRLGARLALGVDVDAEAVRVARVNAVLNRSRARFLVGSIDHVELPARVDVIVANLFAELHVELMPAYRDRLNRGGRLLLTGILARLEPIVLEALPEGWPRRTMRQGEWSLLAVGVPS